MCPKIRGRHFGLLLESAPATTSSLACLSYKPPLRRPGLPPFRPRPSARISNPQLRCGSTCRNPPSTWRLSIPPRRITPPSYPPAPTSTRTRSSPRPCTHASPCFWGCTPTGTCRSSSAAPSAPLPRPGGGCDAPSPSLASCCYTMSCVCRVGSRGGRRRGSG